MRFFIFSLLFFYLIGGGMAKDFADIVLKDCTVITLDEFSSIASTVAIKDGKIFFVGDYGSVKEYIGNNTKVYSLNFSYVFPGFTDSHCHMNFLGEMLYWIDLRGVTSMDEVVRKLKDFRKLHPDRKVLIGFNLRNLTKFDNKKISSNFKDIPVIIYGEDLHSLLVNDVALKLSKISENTKINGGKILKKGGKLTGVLVDRAMELIKKIIPEYSEEEREKILKLAVDKCLKNGLTEVHDAGIDGDIFKAYMGLHKNGGLNIRVYGMALYGTGLYKKLLENGEIKTDDNMFDLRAVKYFSDGSLGSKSGYMSYGYSDDPENVGINLIDETEFKKLCEWCAEKNLQVSTHAIGDKANEEVLKLYSEVYDKFKGKDLRFRIEHVQTVNEKFLDMVKNLDVIISIQPIHYITDVNFALKRLGDRRIKYSYLWRTFFKNNLKVIMGTDFPVAEISPILNYYVAITRGENEKGFLIIKGEEKLKRIEAIKALTIYPSYAAFQENFRGKIFPGMAADLTVLDRNIIYEPPERVKKTKVLMTVVNGKICYKSKGVARIK